MGGGGYNSYPQLRHNLLSVKDSSNADEVLYSVPHYANYGTKTKYKKLPRTTQIMLWLLAFSIFTLFSLCPLAGLATRYNLTAGGPSENTFYTNAPVFVAGDTNRDATTGSANTSTGVLNDTAKNHALFKTDGTVDANVFDDLLNMVDSEKVWNGVTENANAPTYLTAKNFGKYGNLPDAQKGNAQILVKLFDTTTNSTTNVNAMTGQYWQAVYRSINGENDVLTLYMVRPYLESQQFDSNYGNYSKSAVRNAILSDYTKLIEKFSQVDQYIVAPYQLTSGANASDMSKTAVENGTYLNLGGWQSSEYQTSQSARTLTNKPSIDGNWLSSTDKSITSKLGASGYCDEGDTFWGYEYGVNNGLDGLGDGWKAWESINSNYTDKLWLPSGFEVLHTGYGQTAESELQDTGRLYDEANDIIYLDSNYGKAIAGINSSANTASHKNANRTGLWELNGYDRASNSWAWLRSGYSSADNCARGVYSSGDNYDVLVCRDYGVRVALHLNLGAFKSLLPKETKLNITATNNAVNSLLVLTIMDGDARLAEYSCINGTISTRITLDWNKTYKILATRPFGSSLEVKLDEALQSPTVFACYEISTVENEQMNISFTLTGDGSWKNCVVV